MSEKSFVPEPFSDEERKRMMQEAKRAEYRQRNLGEDITADTQKVFEEEQRRQEIKDADPDNERDVPSTPEEQSAKEYQESGKRGAAEARKILGVERGEDEALRRVEEKLKSMIEKDPQPKPKY